MRRAGLRGLALVAAAATAALLPAAPALAHPLGNFTVNTYSALTVKPSVVGSTRGHRDAARSERYGVAG